MFQLCKGLLIFTLIFTLNTGILKYFPANFCLSGYNLSMVLLNYEGSYNPCPALRLWCYILICYLLASDKCLPSCPNPYYECEMCAQITRLRYNLYKHMTYAQLRLYIFTLLIILVQFWLMSGELRKMVIDHYNTNLQYDQSKISNKTDLL